MQTVQHHLFLCATPTKALCHQGPVGAQCWEQLKKSIKAAGLEDPARKEGVVLRTKADCLRLCSDGPVLLIWPSGHVYGSLLPERIDRIVQQHLIAGEPITEWLVKQFSF
ncbi:MAG: (2Fe-2S) ferredoxin domain-containing protein [Synechococcaceae bacterium WB4_2_0811]|nr:(2Fe-2S) ferredoxin domain-containing protein [Synechococcaceae bacterium WB4_2_0811]NBV69160.1 (2Fe-2S) ferredoxin domain-containing protein [Synechococcaceae bacterium WB4_2_0805]